MNVYRGQKVMVVEDNFMSFKLMEAHFNRANLTMIHAKDGHMALTMFKENPDIELVLMDIQLPGINGLEITRLIREINADIPVIATTGNVFEDDRIACLNAGCNYYITKPIDFVELYKILDIHLT